MGGETGRFGTRVLLVLAGFIDDHVHGVVVRREQAHTHSNGSVGESTARGRASQRLGDRDRDFTHDYRCPYGVVFRGDVVAPQ